MLIELVEIQTAIDSMKIEMSERAFQRGGDLRILLKRWEDSGPHAAEWTKDLRDHNQAAQAVIASAIGLQKGVNVLRRQRNGELVTMARNLDTSQDRHPSQLLSEMLAAYRHELKIDLPPIQELFNDLDRRVSEIETLVESRLSTKEDGPAPKWFGLKKGS